MENKRNKPVDTQAFLVSEFEASSASRSRNSMGFVILLAVCLALAMTGAALLGKVKISEVKRLARLKKMDVSFLIKQKPKPKPVLKKAVPKKKRVQRKPIKRASLKKEIKVPEKTTAVNRPGKTAPRKVYGVRRVYSRGLGNGYGGGNAIVAKLGNTLDTPPDTIKATKEDLKGQLVSVTKISRMPSIVKAAKPEYTSEMKNNKISGKVKAKVLVDVDGTPKKIIIVKHLGFGTKNSSVRAIRKMRFKPGLLNNSPVAVWIPLTFRFELRA